MKRHKIVCIIGTRPEVIKMAPIIKKLKTDPSFALTVLSTAQHRRMLDEMCHIFGITPDIDLDVMREGQSLGQLTSALSQPLEKALNQLKPDFVLLQGDTTTSFMAALTCYYLKIPSGHVEAGLRTHHPEDPFPEEMNRTLIGQFATLHFAPTRQAVQNLLDEGCNPTCIFETGNPVIDALFETLENYPQHPSHAIPEEKLILVTVHRRENFGKNLTTICWALQNIVERHPEVRIVLPVHLNPNVYPIVHRILDNHPRIDLVEPQGYVAFAHLMQKAYLILSDSGGVQEEAPALGKPVLVMREHTERPEALALGATKLIGANADRILSAVEEMLNNPIAYQKMCIGYSPYGDGKASERIIEAMKSFLLKGGTPYGLFQKQSALHTDSDHR